MRWRWIQVVIAALVAVSAVAFASGEITEKGAPSFIDFTPHGTQPGLTYDLIGSQQCQSCHSGGEGLDHYPFNSWSGSMMANATRDPLFWAALDVANADGKDHGAEGLGEWCLRCHTPKGWYGGRVRKTEAIPSGTEPLLGQVVEGFDGCKLEGQYDWLDSSDSDFGGVSCHSCHRVMETGPNNEPYRIANSEIWLDDTDCNGQGEPCRAGPYSYPDRIPEWGGEIYENPPHAWKHSALHSSSAMCGSCHDVTSPTLASGPFRTLIVDNGTPEGHDTGVAYPIERTYSEWLKSDFSIGLFKDGLEVDSKGYPTGALGQTCQSCHMRKAEIPEGLPDFTELLACSMGPPRNSNLPVHEFVGGNAWIPQIIKGQYPNLNRDYAFDRTSLWAMELLAERTSTVEAVVLPTSSGVTIDVKVTNLSGHKLPTGYGEGRRMWLDVEVKDANGQTVWRNGAFDPATGELSVDAQTKIYEIKQGIWDESIGACRTKDSAGREIFHFALNNCVAKDNRIPPRGFTGGSDLELASVGYSYPETSPGSGVLVNFDVTRYEVPLAANIEWPLHVEARLKYQIASKDYIEFLRDQAVERGVEAENIMCADEPNRPFTVGPQNKTRGQYMYDLWANPVYGRSPPLDAGSTKVSVGKQ